MNTTIVKLPTMMLRAHSLGTYEQRHSSFDYVNLVVTKITDFDTLYDTCHLYQCVNSNHYIVTSHDSVEVFGAGLTKNDVIYCVRSTELRELELAH